MNAPLRPRSVAGGRPSVAGGVRPLALLLLGLATAHGAPVWPQFRGPNGSGVAPDATPPVEFGPTNRVQWRVPVPAGNSSPCIWSNRLFLTASEEGRLEVLCLDRARGEVLWRQPVPADRLEPVYPRLGHPASPTPATDGERVYAYFGSCGLRAYDFAGTLLWAHPLPIPVTEFGTASSPILAGGLLVVSVDQDAHSFLLALNPRTGETVWRTERPGFPRGFGTPCLFEHAGGREIVVPGAVWLTGYDPADGKERWRLRGQGRVVCTSPVSGDGWLYAASWSPGGDAGSRLSMPPFETFAAEHDRNRDGRLTRDEIPPGPLLERFSQIDADKDRVIVPAEWKAMEDIFARAENCLVAVRPGGRGDITQSHVAWKQTRGLPYVPSPLWYRGRIHLVKNGGLASCFEARSGRALYLEERLGAPGDNYASPVAADGRVYVASQNGVVAVLAAADALQVLARNDLREPILATPAPVGRHLYVRTATCLYAFGPAGPEAAAAAR